MTSRTPPEHDSRSDEFWREYLTHPDSLMRVGRRVLTLLPSEPRCVLCAAPFRGFGAPAMRLIGKRQSMANPHMCTTCEDFIIRHRGGAEVPGTLLFADIRGSTALAERMTPTDFRDLLNHFYDVASRAVFTHEGTVDKFVGDELVAMFHPMVGDNHPARAIAAARNVLERTGHADPAGPWVPVGAGVHTGTAWFGAIGEGSHVELTAVGDVVNVAARLAAAAQTGEVLVTADAAVAAGLDLASYPRRDLELKGKAAATDVISLRVGPVTPAASAPPGIPGP
jgi:adenylate cyclase